jgi:hypothetical protein
LILPGATALVVAKGLACRGACDYQLTSLVLLIMRSLSVGVCKNGFRGAEKQAADARLKQFPSALLFP